MRFVLLVGAGGFIGSVARYLLSTAVNAAAGPALPPGTLVVNTLGCLAIGFLGGLAAVQDWMTPPVRLLLITGVLGGFTTYSSFAWETVALARNGQAGSAVLNAALHLVLGFGAVATGLFAARAFTH